MFNSSGDVIFKTPSSLFTLFVLLCCECIVFLNYENTMASFCTTIFTMLLPLPFCSLLKKMVFNLNDGRLVKLSFLKLQNILKKGQQPSLSVISLSLKRKQQDHDHAIKTNEESIVYLGTGFEFLPKHTRALTELLDKGLAPAPFKAHGSYDLHRLEMKNKQKIFLSRRDLQGHTLLFGTTGAGKTRCFDLLVTQAIMRGDTVIILDPKGDRDLMEKASFACLKSQRADKFSYLDVFNTKESVNFNPLGSFTRNTEVGERLSSLMPGAGASSTFRDYANSAITASVAVLKILGRNVSIKNIRDILVDHENFYAALFIYFKKLNEDLKSKSVSLFFNNICSNKKEKTPSLDNLKSFYAWLVSKDIIKVNPDLDVLFTIAHFDKNYYLKVSAGILPILNALSSGELTDLLSHKGWNKSFSSVVKQNEVFYVALHCLIDATVGGHLGHLLISDLGALAGMIYAKAGPNTKQISVFIDEASELVNESLVQLLNKSRGAGFSVTLATQTFADLSVRSGSREAANQVVGNCNTLISLRVIDNDTAKTITSVLPTTRIADRSSSFGFSESDDGLKVKDNVTRSIRLRECPIFPQQALAKLPDFEYEAKLCDGRFIKGILPILTMDEQT